MTKRPLDYKAILKDVNILFAAHIGNHDVVKLDGYVFICLTSSAINILKLQCIRMRKYAICVEESQRDGKSECCKRAIAQMLIEHINICMTLYEYAIHELQRRLFPEITVN